MEIPIYAKVSCKDGAFGEVTYVILKPHTGKVTEIVVSNESFPKTEFMVPVFHIVNTDNNHIILDCTKKSLRKMPVFDQTQFIDSDVTGYTGPPYFMWPYTIPESFPIRLEKDHIPTNELTIRRGARVEARDGYVGRVDEFLITPENERITHLVMREGHLWGQKDVTIPVGQIDRYEQNIVHLKLSKQEIEALPVIPLRRR